jgi:hypothetical protein
MLPEPPFGVTAGRTRERLSEEYNISHVTILNYEKYSQALDLLSIVVPELVPKILSGEIKISHENTVELSRVPYQEIKSLSQIISDDASEFVRNLHKVLSKKHGSTEKPHFSVPAGSVKEMPAYDPDAEISSLALTIPSWVSSINRTCSASNLRGATYKARNKLEKQLLELKESIEYMLTAIREEI